MCCSSFFQAILQIAEQAQGGEDCYVNVGLKHVAAALSYSENGVREANPGHGAGLFSQHQEKL